MSASILTGLDYFLSEGVLVIIAVQCYEIGESAVSVENGFFDEEGLDYLAGELSLFFQFVLFSFMNDIVVC